MKCPLRTYNYKGEYDQDQREDLDCLKEECAWWDEQTELCSRVAQVRLLTGIGNVLGRICDRMPKGLEPRG